MTFGSLVLGVLNGMTFGLLAIGIVLVYKSDRFLNLAYAQLGAAPALILAKLVLNKHWGWWPAFAVALAIGTGLGLLVNWAMVARLRARGGSPVSLLLLSIGVGEVLLSLTYVPALIPAAGSVQIKGYPVPFNVHHTIGNVVLDGANIVTLFAAPALVAVLSVFLKFTILGKQIRAVAANPDAARLAGISIRRTSAITWGIAGALSTMTAVLIAPELGTSNGYGPQLLLIALGAAAFGAFTSMPWALAGGLLIGIVQQLSLTAWNDVGRSDLAVLAVIVAAVLVRGRAIGAVFATSGAVTTSQPARRAPTILASHWVVTRRTWLLGGTATIIAFCLPHLPMFRADSQRFNLALIGIYVLVAISLCVLVGWAGQVSLGHFAIVGLGAFVTARLIPHGMSLLEILVIVGLIGAATMVVVGLPALRVPGLSLAVTTLGLAIVAPGWLFLQNWVGSSQQFGIEVPSLPPIVKGISLPANNLGTYDLALALIVLVTLGLAAIRRSAAGRAMVAVRDNEVGAATFGLTPAAVKLMALAISGFIAALAGVVWAGSWQAVTASQFTPDLSMLVLAAPIIGGITSQAGAISGATVLYAMTLYGAPKLTSIFGNLGDGLALQFALGGLGVIAVLLAYPDGFAGVAARWWSRFLDYLARTMTRAQAAAASDGGEPLVVEGAVVQFGGVSALNGASIRVGRGEIVGLIGPNGAGKSTLMNVVSGTVRPQAASVRVFGKQITGLAPEYRAAFGVTRSFQDAALFAGLTVREVVQLAVDRRHRTSAMSSALRTPWARTAERASREAATEVIERLGLAAYADSLVAELSTGTRRICDIAAQVAAQPAVLLLDEPTAGVAQAESEAFGTLLRAVRDELDCAMLVIEHDMALLMGLCDRIYAMDGGTVIAEGTPAAIRANPAVIASYLGTTEVAISRSGPAPRQRAPRGHTSTPKVRTPKQSVR
jgi:ABC-type branched-subunit amino acid transport system ATPase component/ABC-type branched-subunit amino acid transport system permease subunit